MVHPSKSRGLGEHQHNLPSTPSAVANNHRFWFDRDGDDQGQAAPSLGVDGGTSNTDGNHDIDSRLPRTRLTTVSGTSPARTEPPVRCKSRQRLGAPASVTMERLGYAAVAAFTQDAVAS